MTNYLAVDLGATSGRTVLASFDGQRVNMREFTRFENPQLPLGGHIFWDLPHLYNEVLRALRQVKAEGLEIKSIGIDTWGCDFAFFGKDGQLLGLPYCYRDPHTDGAMERYFADKKPQKEVYERTGIQLMPFNSLFQLYTLRQAGTVALENADKILFIPDALIYMLTGEAVCEYTVATTSQMLDPRTGDLDEELLQTVGLQRKHFGRMVQPGEQVGTLTPQVQAATGVGAIPIIAVGSHDTASAVAAVPAEDPHFAYLSCGTWSLLGVESPQPIVTADSFAENFTNEGGLDHTIRFLKNITGLWIFEQCRKEWGPDEVPADVNLLNALCLTSNCQSLIQPDDPRFAHPVSMTAAICEYLTETAQPLPATPADYVRVIFRSLAARYSEVVDVLRRLTSVDIRRLHVIGGGSRNQFLMQFAADALKMPVIAGPQEGTALGNALVQIRAAGLVNSLSESRAIIARSIELRTYMPK
ncbi:MAG: rhamnulokinase [Bacteroidaceae bacterium]|nr:rhamnulokinase [Bacteroidaceae bacterium]